MSINKKLATVINLSGDVRESAFDALVDQSIDPETLNFATDVDSAGHMPDWKWSWNVTTLPYGRESITMKAQNEVPIYKQGTYRLDNFTAFRTRGDADQTHKIFLKWLNEAGTANLVDWVTYDSGSYSFVGVTDSGGTDSATRAQRLSWSVPASYTIPSLNTSTHTYNIGAVSGAYTFTGLRMGNNQALGPFYKGNTYEFVLDSSTNGHPIYLSTDNGDNFVSGNYVGEYTSGVTNSRANNNATMTFVVPADAPSTLTYQCGIHGAMRGNITIKDLKTDSNGAGQDIIYLQHSQEGHATEVPIKEVPTIQSQMCLTYDAAKNKFVPQDLGDYMNKTVSFVNRIKEEITNNSINENRMKTFMQEKNILDASETFVASSLDSAKVEGIISGTKTTLIDSDYIATRLGFTDAASSTIQTENNTTFVQDGALTVAAGTARWYSPRAVTITKIRKHVSVAPAGATLNMTLKKNGSSISTFNIADGSTTNVTNNLNLSVAEGDYLTIDITQIGSSTAGSDLNVVISYK
jgi:hypothetical protein